MMNDDVDLDALFAEASQVPIKPSAALTARILSDAVAAQPQTFGRRPVPVARSGSIAGWFMGLAEGLGGARAVAGLSFAGLTGLFLGVAQPAVLQSLTTLLSGDTTSLDQMDLLPATNTLWTEN